MNSNNGEQGPANSSSSKDHVKTLTTTNPPPPPQQEQSATAVAKDITTTTATKEQQEFPVINYKLRDSISEDPTERNLWHGRSDLQTTTVPGILRSRGPLKKRLSPVGLSQSKNAAYPPPVALKECVTSAFFLNGPMMRQASSSAFFRHDTMTTTFPPPQLRSETSFASNLLTGPLLQTPQILGTVAAKENLLSANNNSKLAPLRTSGLPFATATTTTTTTPFQGPYGSGIQNRKVVTNHARSTTTLPQKVSSVNFPQHFSSHFPHATSGLSTGNGKSGNDPRLPGTTGKATSTNQYLRIMHPFSATPRVMLQKRPSIPEFSPLPSSSKSSLKQNDHASLKQSSSHDAAIDGTSEKHSKKPTMTSNPTKIKTEMDDKTQDRSVKLKKSTSKVDNPFDRSGLFNDVPTTSRPCKCGSSKCLKLYCECFHSAMFCDPNLCRCKECCNLEEYSSTVEPRGARVLAMLKILSKRPRSFDGDGRKGNSATNGCRCKKSG